MVDPEIPTLLIFTLFLCFLVLLFFEWGHSFYLIFFEDSKIGGYILFDSISFIILREWIDELVEGMLIFWEEFIDVAVDVVNIFGGFSWYLVFVYL